MKKTILKLQKQLGCKNRGELSKILGMNRVTLFRIAKNESGKNVARYLVILETALSLLSEKKLLEFRKKINSPLDNNVAE